MLTLLSLFVAFTFAQYDIYYSYSDTNCQNLIGFAAVQHQIACIINTTFCNCLRGVCGKTDCNVGSLPGPPANAVVFGIFNSSNCGGTPTSYYASTDNSCVNGEGLLPAAYTFHCDSSGFSYQSWNSGNCSGAASTSFGPVPIGSSACFPDVSTGTSALYQCSGLCFHEDSVVAVAGKKMSYRDLKAPNSPCHIPHEFQSSGVKITTSCPGVLRLTAEHLVMTPQGFKAAGLLVEGDKLYSKVHSDNADCTVVSVETEVIGKYFGLNCEDGHVEADGYWVSTFGIQHTVPNAWMKVASKFIGVKYASQVGDHLAALLYKLGFY